MLNENFPTVFRVLISSTICRTYVLTAAEIVLSTYSARERLFSSTIGLPLFLVFFFFEKWLRQIIVSEALVDLVIDIWVVNILHS